MAYAIEALQTPDLRVQQAVQQRAQGQTVLAPKCRQEHLKHRQHDEQGHQANDAAQAAGHKRVLRDASADRQAPGEHPQHAHARHDRAVAHAKLPLLGRPEPITQDIERPALQAKAVALAHHVDQAQQAQPADQLAAYTRLQGRQACGQTRKRNGHHRRQPEVFALKQKKQCRRVLRVQRIA